MRGKIPSAIVAITLAFSPAAALGAAFVPPVVTAHQLSSSEAAGQAVRAAVSALPPSVRTFLAPKGDAPPKQQTQVTLAYDRTNLYIAFRCRETAMDRLSTQYTEHDGHVYRDDSVEVFLAPSPDSKQYFQFVTNAAGARYEGKGRPPAAGAWDGEWSADVARGDEAWTALVTIPFASLDRAAPQPGDVWGANFGRREVPHSELSVWSPVGREFHNPRRFGRVVFGEPGAVSAAVDPVFVGVPGRYSSILRLHNPSDSEADVSAEVLCDEKVLRRGERAVPPGSTEWELNFDFPDEGDRSLSVAVSDSASSEIIARTAPVLVHIPPHRATLSRYTATAQKLVAHSTGLDERKSDLQKNLDEVETFARGAMGSREKWDRLGEMLDEAGTKLLNLRYACADTHEAGYVVGWETSLRKVLRDEPFEGPLTGPAKLSAARNEYEAVQVVVAAYGKALRNVSVTVSPLRSASGDVLKPGSVTMNLADYVKTRQPEYDVDYVGWYPDPLTELGPFDVDVGRVQPVWITVRPPRNTPAGTFKGFVTIKPANAAEARIAVEAHVWNFALPRETHLKTAFALFESEIGAWYGGVSEEMRREWYEFLLQHRINPTNIYSKRPVPVKADLPFCVERGLNAFCLAYTHNRSDEGRADLAAVIRDYQAYLKKHGWWDKAYIYGFDEIPPDKYPELRSMYGWVKQEFPDLARMCTVVPNDDLRGFVDIWVPLTANYIQEDAQDYTRARDEVWWYVCCVPQHPYANWFIDYPAIDARILPWMNWKYQVPGILYYSLNLWQTNRAVSGEPEALPPEDPAVVDAIRAGKRWPEIPWNTFSFRRFNGDGMLIYPGLDGRPVSSIRLECLRDGIEDYEYLHLLNDLIDSAKSSGAQVDPQLLSRAEAALAVRADVVESLTQYTQEPDALLGARREIAEIIERLGRVQRR